MRRAERLWMEYPAGCGGRCSFSHSILWRRRDILASEYPVPGDPFSRRNLMKAVGTLAGGSLLSQAVGLKEAGMSRPKRARVPPGGPPGYPVTIAIKPVELAPKR